MKKLLSFLGIIYVGSTLLLAQSQGVSTHTPKPYLQLNLGVNVPTKLHCDGDYHYSDYYYTNEPLSDQWTLKTNLGLTPAVEVMFPLGSRFYLGGEIGYQVPRGLNEQGGGNAAFAFVPICASGKYLIPSHFSAQPELIAHMGYDLFTPNRDFKGDNSTLSGGVCWGAGAGLVFDQRIVLQCLYEQERGRLKFSEDYDDGYFLDEYHLEGTVDYTYSHLTLVLGYRW